MNIELAITILFNNGLLIATDENLVVIEHPTRRVSVSEVQNLLNPYDPRFVTFFQARERVQIFFD